MDTWQQPTPNFNVANQNAPTSSIPDVPQYQNVPTKGQTILGGIGQLAQIYAGAKQQEQQQQFQQAFGQAYASGDRDQLKALVASNPQQFEQIQKGLGFMDAEHKQNVADASLQLQTAAGIGPEAVQKVATKYKTTLGQMGVSPEDVLTTYQQNPQGVAHMADLLGLQAVGPEKYFDLKDREADRTVRRDNAQLQADTSRQNAMLQAQTSRSNAQLAAQTSRSNAQLAASTRNSDPSNVREFQYYQSLNPEQQQQYLRLRGGGAAAKGTQTRQVQLTDGRQATIKGDLHGAGQNAFYEGVDANGNTIRIAPNAISGPATGAGNTLKQAQQSDLQSLLSADNKDLDVISGITGGTGRASLTADYGSRFTGQESRNLYNAAMRIQGRQQNAGIQAAREMGASGINTVAEARMYFQSMPQLDFSSPEALQTSAKAIQDYTNNFNQQYNVDLGGGQQRADAMTDPNMAVPGNEPQAQQPAQAPAAAIQMLQQRPDLAGYFKQKYGYLPEGFQ